MFTQRIISVCLLFLYGIPACIGPGWHRHDSACQHGPCAEVACCSGNTAEQERAKNGSHCHQRGAGQEHGPHVGCEQSLAASRVHGQSESGSELHDRVTALDADDACLICAFYAQAQFAGLGSTAAAASMVVGYVNLSAIDSEAERLTTLQARGPPAFLV